MLKLAIGIRIPDKSEIPATYDFEKIAFDRNNSKIEQGYSVKSSGSGFDYSDYFEVNIHIDQLWDFFWSLTDEIIADDCYCVFGIKDSDYYLSSYFNKNFIKENLEKYRYSLTEDGFLAFGLACQNENGFNEILVESFKYIKIWSNKPDLIKKVLSFHHIEYLPDIAFIDQFPVVSLSLADEEKGIKHSLDIIDELCATFGVKKNDA